ncbi:Vitamin K-dependent gamma-carboxylase [Halovivax ruber XH-70]|uniref:Vitamin K-dependent gamma-carboxylase n=1 Tax=Halovivax ruber (strain DSM 18193 / JCM 13892 / XH-70) TaxID=797302 RepID=L0IFI3_HALRX|nr:HTTM domain-containing protein [Halovivax ruber]AGB16976.1 Vitamin K-dependent gamma-carboxylase [Halovivax ruber XH-70]
MNRANTSRPFRRRLSGALDAFGGAVATRFAIDLRGLAAFRMALGALLLLDLALRSRHLRAFYTDDGVLPRRALFSDYTDVYSVHALSGEPWAITLLFLVAGAFALALLVGYRTRLATVASWLLLLSLHNRNPMVLNGGDSLFALLLFWSIFLPLGARWSVDAIRKGSARADDDTSISSIATMALLLQVVLMYVTNAIHKTRSELWMDGEAVAYIMQADQFSAFLGNHLADFTGLLQAMTVVWVGLLLAAPLLLVLTGWPRALLATLFVGMHLGMAASMQLGIFPVVVVTALLPFYQSVVWDRVSTVATWTGVAPTLERWGDRFHRATPTLPSLPGDAHLNASSIDTHLPDRADLQAGLTHGRTLFSTILPWFFLVLVVLSNAQAVDYTEVPDPAEEILDTAELDQSWQMFAPDPLYTTSWYAVPGELEDGTAVDVMYDRAVSLDRPPNVDETYPSARWRKYLGNVYGATNENHRSYLANHLCESWNRSHETDVETITIERLYERTNPFTGPEASGDITLIEYDCGGEFIQ